MSSTVRLQEIRVLLRIASVSQTSCGKGQLLDYATSVRDPCARRASPTLVVAGMECVQAVLSYVLKSQSQKKSPS